MTNQHVVVLIAVVFFLIPFIIWTVTRFRTKVLQRFSPWHKIALITSSSVCFSIFIVLLVLALTVFA